MSIATRAAFVLKHLSIEAWFVEKDSVDRVVKSNVLQC